MKDIELLRSQETERFDAIDLRISNALAFSAEIEKGLNDLEESFAKSELFHAETKAMIDKIEPFDIDAFFNKFLDSLER